jgi:hypothetical protein
MRRITAARRRGSLGGGLNRRQSLISLSIRRGAEAAHFKRVVSGCTLFEP